jgi:hypothetical protein
MMGLAFVHPVSLYEAVVRSAIDGADVLTARCSQWHVKLEDLIPAYVPHLYAPHFLFNLTR